MSKRKAGARMTQAKTPRYLCLYCGGHYEIKPEADSVCYIGGCAQDGEKDTENPHNLTINERRTQDARRDHGYHMSGERRLAYYDERENISTGRKYGVWNWLEYNTLRERLAGDQRGPDRRAPLEDKT